MNFNMLLMAFKRKQKLPYISKYIILKNQAFQRLLLIYLSYKFIKESEWKILIQFHFYELIKNFIRHGKRFQMVRCPIERLSFD